MISLPGKSLFLLLFYLFYHKEAAKAVKIFFTILPNFRYKFFKCFLYNEVGPAEMHVRSLSTKICSMRHAHGKRL